MLLSGELVRHSLHCLHGDTGCRPLFPPSMLQVLQVRQAHLTSLTVVAVGEGDIARAWHRRWEREPLRAISVRY